MLGAACLMVAVAPGNTAPAGKPDYPAAIESDRTRVEARKLDKQGIQLTYLARNAMGEWVEIAASFVPNFAACPDGNRFFDTGISPHRYAVEEVLTDARVEEIDGDNGPALRLSSSRNGGIILTQVVSLRKGSPWVEVEVEATLSEPKLDYLRSTLTFSVPGRPDFVHSPTTKQEDHFRSGPARDQVIGDHAFHSPALILQKEAAALALIPRLDLINSAKVLSSDARSVQKVPRNKFSVPLEPENNSMPTALDLNVASGHTERPVLSYGLMDFVIGHHVRYQRTNDKSMVRNLAGTRLRFGYSLLVSAQTSPQRAYQQVSRELWERYGRAEFLQRESPQVAMPLPEYVRLIYATVSRPMDPAIQAPVPGYKDNGVFLDFELNGKAVGGMVSPLGVLGFGDALWNFEFWNNVRDAAGMHFWGHRLDMPELRERARRTVNLALQAPQNNHGFFPLIYRAATKEWKRSSHGPKQNGGYSIFAREELWFNVPAMSKTAAHLADYYDWCERDEAILAYLTIYADGLLRLLPADGAMPSYYDEKMQPVPLLVRSAQPAASMWFLGRMAKLTGRADYLDGARRIAGFLRREILPEQRWLDLEPYFSCGQNDLGHVQDQEQGLPVRGNLSTIWAAEGFLALHDATGDPADLASGEAVVDFLAFSQAAWRPHYIYTANGFGGCTADNIDTATWLDARHCELVRPFIEYGLRLGRQDMLERGVAAARAGVALVNLKRHRENGIYRHPNIYGEGLGPENINHEGHNQSAMRTHPSWGECSAIFTGLGNAVRLLGGAYVDRDRGFAVAVEPVRMRYLSGAGTSPDSESLIIESNLAKLPLPWTDPFQVTVRVRDKERIIESTHEVGTQSLPPSNSTP